MKLPDGFPSLDSVTELYDREERIREHCVHNHNYWRWCHGGLGLVQQHPLSFDPKPDYWHRTERRFLVAYFAKRFRESYAPADAMRRLALQTFIHFDRARQDGEFGEPVLADEANWPELVDDIHRVASRIPRFEEYGTLKKVWRQLKQDSLREDLLAFLERARQEEIPDRVESSFFLRLAWFPYLGLSSLDDLLDRQRFFFGFYKAFTSTNAYMTGGSMGFAPVLQNNPVEELVEYLSLWATGQTPYETGFVVEGKAERRDRSHHSPVVELHGFLNLHTQPFHNKTSAPAYDLFEKEGDESVFDRLARVGRRTREYLKERPELVAELAARFRDLTEDPDAEPAISMEGIRLAAVRKKFPDELGKQADVALRREIEQSAKDKANSLDDLDAATAMFHLMLDAQLWDRVERGPGTGTDIPTAKGGTEVPPGGFDEPQRLPAPLLPIANDALGYLRAGYHVLFAGPPGTGKTTVAQFVGHAWNHGLDDVSDHVPETELPTTVVANSAWAPFHTIGGILPDRKGEYRAERGLFLDADYENEGEWQLRPECIVLDEMNRADLDRCIGDLYPLLSQTVLSVEPSGIPGIVRIRQHRRFRIIATVNDASLDDVVFPISEGLARRFLRIELKGAIQQDLDSYLRGPDPRTEQHRQEALQVVDELFELFADENRLESTELGEHMPFGVGYFRPLRSWVDGTLKMSEEFEQRDLRDQAREVVQLALRSGARVKGLERILQRLGPTLETT